jgi:glutamyl-tRNA synthetase
MSVRVRFAPSPTGNVHIGNIRTALFNWLYARHEGGKFLVRVEDTDQERSTPEAVKTVFDALEWLGLDHDEEPLYQSTRREVHLTAAAALVERGQAYLEDKGETGRGDCVIFKMPDEAVTIHDELKGELTKQPEDLKDFVIVRSDGSPVFHLGNVVDDIEMGITHVIRGDDHLENTFRHVALYRALEAELPTFVHLPMIVNEQGKPYSKRDGAAFVGEFRDRGFLPEALVNYLALLGWAPGDDREVMTRDEMISAFTLDRIHSSAAQMGMSKLEWMNGEYMRHLPVTVFKAGFVQALETGGIDLSSAEPAYMDPVVAMMQIRTNLYTDAPSDSGFFFTDDYAYDEKALRKRVLKPNVPAQLAELKARFEALASFDEGAIEDAVRQYAEEQDLSAGKLVHPLRVAVSGIAKGPGLFEMLAVLGKARVAQRIDRTLSLIETSGADSE